MITFPSPITLIYPTYTLPDGGTITPNPVTLESLDYSVNYNNTHKVARANFIGLPIGITLWRGADYDAAGQFTDADVQARITTILGDSPQETLQALLPKQA
jgi:hypothetical protein